MAQYTHLSTPDPEIPPIPKYPGVLSKDAVPAMRKLFTTPLERRLAMYEGRLPDESSYKVQDHALKVDGGEITVRVVTPVPTADEGAEFEFPVMVYFHGGGWVVGGLHQKDFDLRIISVEMRLVTVNVDYRLAPEYPFPIPVNDSYAALKWTVENAQTIHASPSKGLIVCGASAGANLAAVVAHRSLKDPFFAQHEGRKVTGQILQIPVLVHPQGYPTEYAGELLSYEQNRDAPILPRELMDLFWECYAAPPTSPDLAPLLADRTGLKFPPVHFQICGLDPLRDEGLLYERLLREEGVKTKLDIYPGAPHGFSSMFPATTAGKKWDADWREGIRWLLAGKGMPN
ncbi:Esterase/lipase/thioesterase [Favolaschia claudopus]|uniref:Esterase/lipase/thioesterase n=1 Tax=Favolaschia claudopus TaxID=2862362 RepID=A0AAW0CEB5_9AGAR